MIKNKFGSKPFSKTRLKIAPAKQSPMKIQNKIVGNVRFDGHDLMDSHVEEPIVSLDDHAEVMKKK